MSKTKMTLAGTGGAIGLVVLVLAFLVWQAFSAKRAALEGDPEERVEGLESVESSAETLSRKKVYPSAASVKAIEANREALDGWRKEGMALAVRGDRVYEKTTAPKFKAFLLAEAHRIAELPGGVAGRLVKPEFAFGPFKEYIAEGKMPAEADLANLQRQWDDVSTIAELLSTNGVDELVDVGLAVAKKEEEPAKKDARQGKAGRKKGPSKTNGRAAERPIASHSYVFTFAARPPAFVRMLNELERCERFVVVDDFAFARAGDAIADALAGDEKKAEGQTSGRRNRRRRGGGAESAAPQEKDAAVKKGGVVTDPLQDAPMTVTMTVTVHDFRSLEADEEEETRPQGKGGSK